MRLVLFILGLCIASVCAGTRVEAQNYPWCAIFGGDDGGTNCGYTTFEQCLENARGMGSICQPNTQYVPAPRSPNKAVRNRNHS
jgi:hypothetical protein